MNQNKFVLIIIIASVLMVCAGCSEDRMEHIDAESDVELETPAVSLSYDENETKTRDYSGMQIVDGFWVKEMKEQNEALYAYIPIMSQRVVGIYDFEDFENFELSNKYTNYNQPDGTKPANTKGWCTSLFYYTNSSLGFNSDPELEKINQTEKVRYVESFAMVGDDNKINTLYSYDVGCVTFALFKDLYENYPEIKLQVYGVPTDLISEKIGDLSNCDQKIYMALLKECVNNNMDGLTLFGEKSITDTCKLYIDYKKLSQKGKYCQFLLVLNVSELSGFAYYMNGDNYYVIDDQAKYEEWKKSHIEQFVGE